MLFLKREYVADSDSSSSGSEEAEVPTVTQVPQVKTQSWVGGSQPTPPDTIKPTKVGIYIPEPPSARPGYQRVRPGTGARPGSANIAMRNRMQEQQRNKPIIPVAADPDIALDELDKILHRQGNRPVMSPAYEPAVARMKVPLPAAVSVSTTVFKTEEIEEVKLEEIKPQAKVQQVAFNEYKEAVVVLDEADAEEMSPSKPAVQTSKPTYRETVSTQTEPVSAPEEQTATPLPAEESKATPLHRSSTLDTPTTSEEPPKPVPRLPVRQLLATEMMDMKKFLTSPIPKNVLLLCSVRRDSKGLKKKFYPKYLMHLSEGYSFLLAGKKRAKSKTSNYLISMHQNELSTRSPGYLGKLRSNFLGTQFVIYDSGEDPSKKTTTVDNVREELGVVFYQSNILADKGPRKMRVLLPFVNLDNERLEWKPQSKEETMTERYNQGDTAGMMTYFNKPPKWNEHIQAFVLNFNGRVDKASVKNFQLIDDQDENKIYLQFGRVSDTEFNLDFQWPFSPMQAFALALSSFDYKLACE